MIIRKLIRIDGTEVNLEVPQSLAQVERLIGATTLDTVVLRDRKHVMLVDDTGAIDGKPVNEIATLLYREVRPGSSWQICGDVVVVPDSDYAPIGGY